MNYEEDLESAKGWLAIAKENNNNLAIQILEKLFPELKESEDERIRKALIRNFTNQHSGNFPTADGFTREQILAWLEKQGEKEPIEQDTEIRDLWEYIREWRDKFGRLPKDEDELADCIFYVMKRQKPIDKVELKFKVGDIISDGNSEVRIVSIAENRFNVTNGEIENDANICNWVIYFKDQENWKLVNKSCSEENEKHPQPKQEWSDEYEKHLSWLIEYLGQSAGLYDNLIDWLKSLKPQSHWRPNNEQMDALKNFIEAVETSNYAQFYLQWLTGLKSLYNELKKL